MIRLRSVVPILLLAALVAACGDESDDPAPEPTDDPAALCVQLLGDDDVEALAGAPLGEPVLRELNGFTACEWAESRLKVQASRMPASQWADALGTALDSVRDSDELTDDDRTTIEEATDRIASAEGLDDDAACDLFAVIAKSQGRGENGWFVGFVPSAEEPLAVTGQLCLDGAFATVQLSTPGLTGDDEELTRAEAALRAAAGLENLP